MSKKNRLYLIQPTDSHETGSRFNFHLLNSRTNWPYTDWYGYASVFVDACLYKLRTGYDPALDYKFRSWAEYKAEYKPTDGQSTSG